MNRGRQWLHSHLPFRIGVGEEWHFKWKYPFARKPSGGVVADNKPVDFNRGPAELAEAIRRGGRAGFRGSLALHIVEIIGSSSIPRTLWRQAQN